MPSVINIAILAGSMGPRNLSDIDRSTATNDGQASTLFSVPKNPQRIPANTPPVFRGLRPSICLPFLRLVTNGNVGQAPRGALSDRSIPWQLRLHLSQGFVDAVLGG